MLLVSIFIEKVKLISSSSKYFFFNAKIAIIISKEISKYASVN